MQGKCFLGLVLFCLGAMANPLEEVSIPEKIAENFETFEPSAAIYLEDLDRFLVASDDTDEGDQPYLFLMDHQGNLEETPILAKGLDKMTDIESMSLGADGSLYLLSSQGLNKNGKEKTERNILAKAIRKGRKITVENYTELRPRLLSALENSSDPLLKTMAETYYEELDIEASLIVEGRFLVGLKNPQPTVGRAVILDLGSPEDLLSEKKLEPHIWKTIDFSRGDQEALVLSDMVKIDDNFYLTTTVEDGTLGQLWRFSPDRDDLTLLASFDSAKPEALAAHLNGTALLVLFDAGEENALFTHFSIEHRE